MKLTDMLISFSILAGGCATSGDTHQVDVAPNAVGITTLRTGRVQEAGNDVYSLRGYSADDRELASVRLTIGVVADLPQLLPGDDHGSEIVLAAAGTDYRIVTHETQLFQIDLPMDRPAIAQFLALPAVATLLDVEAHILVPSPTVDESGELAYDVGPPSGAVCPAGFLNVSPIADQCCWTNPYPGGGQITLFIRASDHGVISRKRNPSNLPCKAADGTSPCNGAACYYGPNDFARATVSSSGTNPVIRNHHDADGITRCSAYTTGGIEYSNITGTVATGQGCPGSDGGGGIGAWDY